MPVTRSVLDKNERQTRPADSDGGLVQSAVLAEDADELDKLDMSSWEDLVWKREIEEKLKESCKEAMSPDCKWLTEEEVYGPIDKIIADYEAGRTGLGARELKNKGKKQNV